MTKSLFFIMGLLGLNSLNTQPVLHTRNGLSLETVQNKRAVLAWDLNSVIFEKKVKIGSMLKHAYKKKGVRGTIKNLWKFKKLWRKKKKLKKQGKSQGFVWDAMFTELEQKDKKTADFLREFAQQANVLDLNMVALMQSLSCAGHNHAILSNMGQSMLDAQVKQLQAQPVQNYTAYILDFFQDDKHKIIASAQNNWVHKPNRDAYTLWLNANKDRGEITIFIDDKITNVEAALKNGFDIAIHYKKGSTPAQLAQILKEQLKLTF